MRVRPVCGEGAHPESGRELTEELRESTGGGASAVLAALASASLPLSTHCFSSSL